MRNADRVIMGLGVIGLAVVLSLVFIESQCVASTATPWVVWCSFINQ